MEKAAIVLMEMLFVTQTGSIQNFAFPGKIPPKISLTFPPSNGATECETLINGTPAITGVCTALNDEFCGMDCCGNENENDNGDGNLEPCDL